MSLVSGLNIAQQALSVNQAAITVISNNIANVDNENYSKLRVELASVVNSTTAQNTIAEANTLSGVKIAEIKRYSNAYLQSYYWQENSTNSYLEQYASVASNIESLTNELNDTGLAEAFSNFYDAVDALNDNPTDTSARANYLAAADNVCSVFNSIYNNLGDIQKSLVGDYTDVDTLGSSEIVSQISSVNQLLEQIANVNDSIKKTSSAEITSSALLDQRDALISEISAYIPVTVSENNNGTIDISMGDYKLVSSTEVVGYLRASSGSTAAEPVVIDVVDATGTPVYNDVNSQIDSGSMGAILDICGTDTDKFTINSVMTDLNFLANTFATTLNTIQSGDPNTDSSVSMCIDSTSKQLIRATENIFVSNDALTPTINAGNISVNSAIKGDSNLIAAARLTAAEYADFVATGEHATDTGNNKNSTMMVNSRTASNDALDDQTFERYLSSTVTDVGSAVSNISNDLKTQTTVLNEVTNKLTSETGVNLDEELGELIKYQRAYQAAARVFSVCSSLMEELIHLGQ